MPRVHPAAQKCDYDEKTPGNGFRSLICLCDTTILHLVSVFKECSDTRDGAAFRAIVLCKELETYVAILRFLVLAFQQVTFVYQTTHENYFHPKTPSSDHVNSQFPICSPGILLLGYIVDRLSG